MTDASEQEPSMEEILASIRRIISEEGDSKPAAAPPAPERRAPPAQARPSAPAPAQRRSDDDVIELTQPAAQPAAKAPPEPPPSQAPTAYRVGYQLEPQRRPSPSTGDDELMSAGPASAASAAFAAVAGGGTEPGLPPLPMGEGGRTLEELVRETLRPLLKAWLDQNLPPLVERMVRVEIERLSRRG
jgi:cell pole-organizing protein PopZ